MVVDNFIRCFKTAAALPSMNTIPKYTLVYAPTCSLLYVGWYCWVMIPLMPYADVVILWSSLKGGPHCCERSSFHENTGHKKMSVLYRLCIEILHTTLLYKNYLCIAVSHNSTLRRPKHLNYLEHTEF
jgi:hypothetical protein